MYDSTIYANLANLKVYLMVSISQWIKPFQRPYEMAESFKPLAPIFCKPFVSILFRELGNNILRQFRYGFKSTD